MTRATNQKIIELAALLAVVKTGQSPKRHQLEQADQDRVRAEVDQLDITDSTGLALVIGLMEGTSIQVLSTDEKLDRCLSLANEMEGVSVRTMQIQGSGRTVTIFDPPVYH